MVEFRLRPVDEALRARYEDEGLWSDENLGRFLADGLAVNGSLPFAIHSAMRPYEGTQGDVLDLARRFAGGLRSEGVEAGDLVAVQTPNWMEGAVTFYAIALLGAVPIPIVHFYGPKEVGFILRQSEARTFVTAANFGPLDFLANLETVRDAGNAEHLARVVVFGGEVPDGCLDWDDLASADPIDDPAPVDAARPALVAYTSGTTADPKGVVHTHRSIIAEIRQLAATQMDDQAPMLVSAPIGHAIGMLSALMLPVVRAWPIHLLDAFDPQRVLDLMEEHGLNGGSGATFFLQTLLDHPGLTDRHLELMRYTGLGGSAVPSAVTERADAHGIQVVRMYGSTEHPSTTGARFDGPREKRLYTDGAPLPGVEIRLVDVLTDEEVEPGEPGHILSRGPDLFAGYTDPALTAESFTETGWYRTGDVGVVDADGWLTITDRIKDVIIRGGENVSAAEVEEQLIRMPGVAEVAVVAAPDERLGEHAAAFVRMQPDREPFDLPAVQEHLREVGLAKQKWPEELHVVADFPRTPSGKIQKFKLRDDLRSGAGG